jgi:hypothetical protein
MILFGYSNKNHRRAIQISKGCRNLAIGNNTSFQNIVIVKLEISL